MLNRKSLTWFLIIAFGISWALFCVPLAFETGTANFQNAMLISFMAAMWGPGIAALLTTHFVEGAPLSDLRLNTLGPKRLYLWAWLLPPALTVLTLFTSLLLGVGQLDLSLSMMREGLAQAPQSSQPLPPVEVLVVAQLFFAFTLAPLINVPFAMGEELGWRGFLLPHLLPLGQGRAILISGLIWGVWHAPTTLLYGYNFPMQPYLGALILPIGFSLLGAIIAWLYLRARSPWIAALAHGSVNASPGLAIFFLKPGFDTALGGSLLGLSGWIPMALFIAWLLYTRRLPVDEQPIL